MIKKIILISSVTLALGVALLIYYPVFDLKFYFPYQAKKILNQTDIVDIANSGAGVFQATSGEWVAILHKDYFHRGLDCYNIARCSNGIWLISDEHFCVSLKLHAQLYRKAEEKFNVLVTASKEDPNHDFSKPLKELKEELESNKVKELCRAKDAHDLILGLKKLGFYEIEKL